MRTTGEATFSLAPTDTFNLQMGDFGIEANSQDTDTLPGNVLRLDVNGTFPYSIPSDNPFADGGGAPEIFAAGLRNPWRGGFDSATGQLWVGDVGVNEYEKINKVHKGGNYGWPVMEGLHCRNATACDDTGLIAPIVEYPHAPGSNAVIGGPMYNGSAISSLQGTALYGDVASGEVTGLFFDDNGTPAPELLVNVGANIFSFAEGPDKEVYVLRSNRVDKLVPTGSGAPSTFPTLLSETGCVDPLDPKEPAPGLIPYDVLAVLWSDGAKKKRFIAMPDWLKPNTTIGIEPDGDFRFPIGTVLLKEFRLGSKIVETRLLVRHSHGEWAGYSYEWNDAQTDATLVAGSKTRLWGQRTWTYPSRSECLQCHTAAAGRSLGPEIIQLHTGKIYPSTGRKGNQLATFDAIGLFTNGLPAPLSDLSRLVKPGLQVPGGGAFGNEHALGCTPTVQGAIVPMVVGKARWIFATARILST
jgi:hypothetical protein